MENIKIKGLKKTVGKYKELNAGYYSPRYGHLMFDKESGELWVNEFYSFGHRNWVNYNSKDIVNLGKKMEDSGIEVNMRNVREFIEKEL